MGTIRRAAIAILALAVSPLAATGAGLGGLRTVAASTEPTIYVANHGANTITEYSAEAKEDAPPVRRIIGSDPATKLNGPVAVALDHARTLYVANYGASTITEYRGADPRPIHTITGLPSAPKAIAVDSQGNLYVATTQAVPTYGPVLTQPRAAPASSSPGSPHSALQAGPTSSPTPAPASAECSWDISCVLEYLPEADGPATPSRIITGVGYPQGVAVDAAQNLYVLGSAEYGGPASINEYSPTARGNAAPVATITGSGNGVTNPYGAAFDAAQRLYVVNYSSATSPGQTSSPGTGSISEYAPGLKPTTPTPTIEGVDRPVGISLDGAGNLYVAGATAGQGAPGKGPYDRVTEYAPTPTKNASPIRSITGPHTEIDAPAGVAVVNVPPPPTLPPIATSTSTSTQTSTSASTSSASTSTSASSSTSRPVPPGIAAPILPLTPTAPPPPGPPPPSLPSTASPLLHVSPSTGSPGQLVTAHGSRYPPNALVTLVFSPAGGPTPAGSTGPGARRPDEQRVRVAVGGPVRVVREPVPAAETASAGMATPPFTANRAGEFVVSFLVPLLPPDAYVVEARSPCCQDQRVPFSLVPPASGRGELTQLSQSLPSLGQVADAVRRDPTVLAHGLVLAAFMVLVVGFPAELFNKTLEENDQEVRRWFRWLRAPARLLSHIRPSGRLAHQLTRPGVQFAAFCVVAATLTALVDPDVLHYCQGGQLVCTEDWWTKTLQVFIGFLVAIPLTTLLYAVPEEAVSRAASRQGSTLRVVPLGLLAAAVFAAASAVGQFLPGYVYGLLAGYAAVSTRRLSRHDEGVAALAGGTAVLALSFLGWLLWGPIREAAEQPEAGFAIHTLNAVLSQVVLLGVQAVVFGLMPFTFLAGARLTKWSWWVWGAVYGAAAAFYSFVLVVSTKETLGKARADHNEAMVIGLFIGFGVVSILFWGYFRLRARHRARTTTGRAA